MKRIIILIMCHVIMLQMPLSAQHSTASILRQDSKTGIYIVDFYICNKDKPTDSLSYNLSYTVEYDHYVSEDYRKLIVFEKTAPAYYYTGLGYFYDFVFYKIRQGKFKEIKRFSLEPSDSLSFLNNCKFSLERNKLYVEYTAKVGIIVTAEMEADCKGFDDRLMLMIRNIKGKIRMLQKEP